jgi:uncharacterized membrane protein
MDLRSEQTVEEKLTVRAPASAVKAVLQDAAALRAALRHTLERLQHLESDSLEAAGALPHEPTLDIVEASDSHVAWLVRVRDDVRYEGRAELSAANSESDTELRVTLIYDPTRHVVQRWLEKFRREEPVSALHRDLVELKQRLEAPTDESGTTALR